jgi:acetyltransferase-like isoleucine patch superfamily enzyme
LSHPDWVTVDDAVIDDGVVLGYAWTEPPPRTTFGAGCRIRTGAIVYAGVTIGARAHIGHGALIRQGTRIGDDCSIGSRTIIEHEVTIGNRVRIHSGAFIPELTVIEDDAWIGPMVCVTNARYPTLGPKETRLAGVRIERGAKVGGAAVLLPGVVIGEGALVGAGAVVTRDVKPGMVVAGNPATELGTVEAISKKIGTV